MGDNVCIVDTGASVIGYMSGTSKKKQTTYLTKLENIVFQFNKSMSDTPVFVFIK